jgi:hypothetical protein
MEAGEEASLERIAVAGRPLCSDRASRRRGCDLLGVAEQLVEQRAGRREGVVCKRIRDPPLQLPHPRIDGRFSARRLGELGRPVGQEDLGQVPHERRVDGRGVDGLSLAALVVGELGRDTCARRCRHS